MTTTIDLSQPPAGHKFDVTIEKEESPAERSVRLFKDVAIFVFALAIFASIVCLCLWNLVYNAASSADEKKWSMSVLAAAAGGLLGYLVRK